MSAPELQSLPGVEHRFVEAGGLTFHVAFAGDEGAPPLLLLHGWPQHWWMWRKVVPELSRSWRLVMPDLRGLGWTDAPDGGYDKPQLARDVLALLDELGLDRVRVIGHDWGAVSALHMITLAPERLVRVLALSIPDPRDNALDPRRLVGIAHMPVLSAPFAERAVPQIAWQLLRLSRFSRADAEPYLEVLRQPARSRASVAYYRTFLLRELPGIVTGPPPVSADVPLQFVGGVADPVCRFSPSVELVRGAAHFLPEDNPDAVLARAKAFL